MIELIDKDDVVRFDFVENKYKQKIWIDAMVHFIKMDINKMAEFLELPVDMLVKVQQGSVFFSKESAERLGRLFLLVFSD